MLKIVIKPLVLTGPTGSGRTVMAFKLVTDFPHKFEKVVSFTSRPKRKAQLNGFHYHFLTREQMEQKHKRNEFLILKKDPLHGQYYGTTQDELDRIARLSKIPVLEMNAMLFGETMNKTGCNGIYLKPHSYEELRMRTLSSTIMPEQEVDAKIKQGMDEEQHVIKERIFPEQNVITNKDLGDTYLRLKARLFQLY